MIFYPPCVHCYILSLLHHNHFNYVNPYFQYLIIKKKQKKTSLTEITCQVFFFLFFFTKSKGMTMDGWNSIHLGRRMFHHVAINAIGLANKIQSLLTNPSSTKVKQLHLCHS